MSLPSPSHILASPTPPPLRRQDLEQIKHADSRQSTGAYLNSSLGALSVDPQSRAARVVGSLLVSWDDKRPSISAEQLNPPLSSSSDAFPVEKGQIPIVAQTSALSQFIKNHRQDEALSVVAENSIVSSAPTLSRSISRGGGGGAVTALDEEYSSPSYYLPGGSITRDIYKLKEDSDRRQVGLNGLRRRSFSQTPDFSNTKENSSTSVSNIIAPGGFRRHFIHQRRAMEGKKVARFFTNNFIDFLELYGNNFAGFLISLLDDSLFLREFSYLNIFIFSQWIN